MTTQELSTLLTNAATYANRVNGSPLLLKLASVVISALTEGNSVSDADVLRAVMGSLLHSHQGDVIDHMERHGLMQRRTPPPGSGNLMGEH